jgi:galactoside 2-L-fucosyltransferase 1/2
MKPLLKRMRYFLYFVVVLTCVIHVTTSAFQIKVDKRIERAGNRFRDAISLRYRYRFNSSGDVHTMNTHNRTSGTIFHTYRGRLGNHLFQFAAITAIAKNNGMNTCIREVETLELASFFHGVGAGSSCDAMQPWRFVREDGSCQWQIFELHHQDTLLEGYFQSYKYIDPDMRKTLRFKSLLMSHARVFLQNFPERVLVGIHVRRYESPHLKTPSRAYFENAMEYFEKRYTNVGFVVISDDPDWCNGLAYFKKENVHVSLERQHYALDMAILSACDHIILSVGTFGFWAAYLGADSRENGTVVYYDSEFVLVKNFKEQGRLQPEDYYPPGWIAIGDAPNTRTLDVAL